MPTPTIPNVAVIVSSYSFEETKKKLESTIPPLDNTYQADLIKGNYAAARAALEALPPLNNFIIPPRNFGSLLGVIGEKAQSVVYEVGNPLTATKLASYNLEISTHTPRRIQLLVENGKVKFRYDLLLPIVAQYGIKEMEDIARELDAKIVTTLEAVAQR
ncbi:hypothetical protein F5Y16DRAFT_357844 [Xylariaceae sp. FL0255]|nr:hypothetical protein F5Y16DRAFT_357844 [Xylariaceae sp. FL0255]